MCTYEVAFGSAVQLDEPKARRNISIITFYGGNRLDDHLDECCADVGVFRFTDDLSLPGELDAGWSLAFSCAESALSTRSSPKLTRTLEPFRWSLLTQVKQVLLTMGSISTLGF